jgi:hypothetical protein
MTLERRKGLGPGRKSLDRGSTFDKTRSELRRRRRPRRRRTISPASEEQRIATAAADHCVGCGRSRGALERIGYVLDPGHLAPRSKGGCDDVRCAPFPLCRNRFNGEGCHRAFDQGELDLLPLVSGDLDRFRPALQHALEHLGPVQLVERLGADRTQWSSLA